MRKQWLHLAVGGALAASAAVASAQAPDDRGWLLEASVLQVDSSLYRGARAGPNSSWVFTGADEDRGFTVKGSYAFTRHFALQAGYYDIGDHLATPTNTCTTVCTLELLLPQWVDIDGLSLAGVGTWHATEKVEVFGKLGVFRHDADRGAFFRDDRGTDSLHGAGVGVWLTPEWRLDVQYERVDFDFDSVGVGATYRFQAAPAQRRDNSK
jgi:opacity protein-like surface antigen